MNYCRSVFLLIIFSFNLAFSQSSPESPFELKTAKEAAIIGAGVVVGISALLVMSNIDILSDEKIYNFSPENVNAFDRIAIGPFSEDNLGDALLYGSFLLPLTFLTYDQTREDFGTLALMYGEVVLLNAGINGLVKGLTARARPFVYDENSPAEEKFKLDARHSFYSGHTSMSASNSFFTAKVFSEYLSDNTTKFFIWGVAALIPAVTGFSRVSTHNHFPTDVIAGYIVGAAIGYLIPEIHKYEKKNDELAAPREKFIHRPMIGFQISF
jgi:membrane-associated phospholipid phosphatase